MSQSNRIEVAKRIHDKLLTPGKTRPVTVTYPVEEPDHVFFGNYYPLRFPYSDSAFRIPPIRAVFEKILVYFSLILVLPLIALRVPYILFRQKKKEEANLVFALNFVPRLLRKELGVGLSVLTLTSLLLANLVNFLALTIKSIFSFF